MVGELDEFGVCASNIAELGSTELGQIGLSAGQRWSGSTSQEAAYVDIEAQDRVLATSTLESGDFGLKLVLFSWLLGRLLLLLLLLVLLWLSLVARLLRGMLRTSVVVALRLRAV